MPARDLFIIVNPAADRGRAAAAVPRIERHLRSARSRFRIEITRAPGHAAELAAGAARAGWPVVVAAGGDGVVHEVVNGLMRAGNPSSPAVLGVIGWGSGNDFIKMLGLPARQPEAALRRILEGDPRPVDVGHVVRCVADRAPAGEWYFANGIGLGLDAQVAVEASRIRKLRGPAIYAVALARTLRRLRAPHVRVEVDGRVVADQTLILATIANGGWCGGSFRLCPEATVADGLLDVLAADARDLRDVLTLVPRVMRGTHLHARGVQVQRGTRVEIRSAEPLPLHADGELLASGVRELSVRLLPGRLRVMA